MLLVEGNNDTYFIRNLAGKIRLSLPDSKNNPVNCKTYSAVLRAFKGAVLGNLEQPLGIIVDLDSAPESRKDEIRALCQKYIESESLEFSLEGYIGSTKLGKKIGVWLWPDNLNPGIMEDLAISCIPDSDRLISKAKQCVEEVQLIERRFKPQAQSKAIIHTWLAWQEEPGAPLGMSVQYGYFDLENPTIKNFKNWLTRLYSNDEKTDS